MAEPDYETRAEGIVCRDCGVVVVYTGAHTIFHGALSRMAEALAVLQNAHISAPAHDKYDVRQRIENLRRMHSLTKYLEPVKDTPPQT